MRTRDHQLLGQYLLERFGAAPDPLCRNLFLLGCVEPDWNFITYIRGSIRHQFLHGHNAENAACHLERLTERLLESGVSTPLQWFRLGVAMHYLADRFTFAHNQCFRGGLLEHSRYEALLHRVFVAYLREPDAQEDATADWSHAEYLQEQRSFRTDCRFILGAALALCRRLSVQWVAERLPAPQAQPVCIEA